MNTFFYNIFLSLRLPGPSFLFSFLLYKNLHLFAFIPGWFLFSCRYGFNFLFMSSFLFLPAHYFGGGVCRFFLFSSCTFLFSLISSHRAGIFLHLFSSPSPFKISNSLFTPLSLAGSRSILCSFSFLSVALHSLLFCPVFFFPSKIS